MGIGTILDSRQVVMLAFGEKKAEAVAAMVEGPITANLPASALQFHTRTHVFLDEGAAGGLARKDYYRWVYDNKPDWQQH
jgi:glucosamine-6-phosphate deaminase